ARGIADGGRVDARSLPELALGAPEAAQAEHRLLEPGREWRLDAVAVDEVGRRHGERCLVTSRQRAAGRRHLGFLAKDLPHGPLLNLRRPNMVLECGRIERGSPYHGGVF